MTVAELKHMLHKERMEAIATRDPLAIKYADSRWEVITQLIAGKKDDEELDLKRVTVGVKAASEVLGYTPQQVRKLIREKRLDAHKEGEQWRIPLKSIL